MMAKSDRGADLRGPSQITFVVPNINVNKNGLTRVYFLKLNMTNELHVIIKWHLIWLRVNLLWILSVQLRINLTTEEELKL